MTSRPLQVEYRRTDGELLGWIRLEADNSCTPIDLIGHRGPAGDWGEAEAYLQGRDLSYLADIYAFELRPNWWVRVKIVEVNAVSIHIKEDDFGDATASTPTYDLPFPADQKLVPIDQAPGEVHLSS